MPRSVSQEFRCLTLYCECVDGTYGDKDEGIAARSRGSDDHSAENIILARFRAL